jgi:tripartite-type tricarboxylate transporter receptor subunit TctC
MKEVMARPEVVERLEKAGFTPLGNSPAEFSGQIRSEIDVMKKLVKERNISLDE